MPTTSSTLIIGIVRGVGEEAGCGGASEQAVERARRNREDPDAEIALRLELARALIVQSGAFQITNGKVLAGQGTEPTTRSKPQAGARQEGIVDAIAAGLYFFLASSASLARAPRSMFASE
jgi:hypothetical protein